MKERVEERLKALELNPFEAATRVGLNRHFIDDILNGKKKSVRGKNLIKLAEALRCSPKYLTGEQDELGEPPVSAEPFTPKRSTAKFLVVAGKCEAGTYRSRRIVGARPTETVPIPLDPRFDALEQAAFLVADGGLAGIRPGTYLVCAKPAAYEREIGSIGTGVIVVVEQARGEDEFELTAREVLAGGVLGPNQLDPGAIANLPWPAPVKTGGATVSVVAVALNAVRLL